MKTEINVWNGGGWNNYAALRTLSAFPAGTKGLLKKNGVQRLEVSPRDAEKPFGIAARYFDAAGELVFTQGFDQNDTAEYIRERVTALLNEGIQNRINARAKQISKEAFLKRVTAWRRNFDQTGQPVQMMPIGDRIASFNPKAADRLRAKFGALREAIGKHSRKECWNFTYAVLTGQMTYRDAVAQF